MQRSGGWHSSAGVGGAGRAVGQRPALPAADLGRVRRRRDPDACAEGAMLGGLAVEEAHAAEADAKLKEAELAQKRATLDYSDAASATAIEAKIHFVWGQPKFRFTVVIKLN